MGMKEEFLSKKFSFPGSFLEQRDKSLVNEHNSRKKGLLVKESPNL